jgi:thiosulfate dehydrogenase [quinone] large subunit
MSLTQNFKQSTYLGYLAILRIAVGYHFLVVALPKITGGFLKGHALPEELAKTVVKDPFAFHRAFIIGFVIPHAHFFSYLVAFGETAIGISLILGCLVRLSSSFGAFHNLNILLSIAIANGGAQVGINRIFIVLHLMFVFSSAGRSLGLDGILKRWFPNSKLF